MKKHSIFIVVFLFCSLHLAVSQDANHWETAVYNNDTWRYYVGNSEPPTEWRSLTFNDSSWPQGAGGFGYGDNDDNTIIPQVISVFIRSKFIVPDTALIVKALLSMDYDDAFVAYLNNVEIGRAGITGTHPVFDQVGVDHEAKMYAGGKPESFEIDKAKLKSCLVPGENVIAIQVHNSSLSSSDLSSNAWLSFGILNSSNIFRPVPSWFEIIQPPANFISSNLPVIIINTDGGAAIPDDPRILASMQIIYRGEGQRNYLTDVNTPEYLNYDGRINIEIRGSSSQAFDKKQYGLSTKKADGITNNNVSLLGMPADNDWILLNSIFDPSMIRNYLSYNLSRMIGEYSSRTVFCEVLINSEYRGLYLLLEKIKPGTNRVNILEIGPNDNSYPEITGGYITKSDKTTGNDPVAWYMSSYNWTNDVQFIHDKPEPENVTAAQNFYIQSEFFELSKTADMNNQSLETGYPSVIDVPSFVDYMLLTELSSNADGYHLSTFYHKDRNGKLRAGPLWDFDLTYGNDLFLWGADRSKTDVWQFANGENDGPRYWKDLFDNSRFRCYLARRWNQLTRPGQPFSYQSIESEIDKITATIAEATVRENTKWGTIGNHAVQITNLKTFLQQRINWITNNIGSYSGCDDPEIPPLVITRINYAPDTSVVFPVSNDLEFIEISNTGDQEINMTGIYFGGTGFVYRFNVNSMIEAGGTKIIAGNTEVFKAKYGFYPNGQFTRSLSNTGENLILADGFGNVIDNVWYSDLPPWPDVKANGLYLELTDPLSDNNIGSNWKASGSVIVSVNEIDTEPGLKLYPAPVTDILYIESDAVIISVELFDIRGTQMKTLTIDSEYYSYDMTLYHPGIYLAKILTPGGIYVKKIIKK